MTVGLVITAAGQSRRYGENKQFVTLDDGRPLIAKTCLAFSEVPGIKKAVVTAHKEDCTRMQELLASLQLSYDWEVVQGAETRAESVRAGVTALSECRHVMIHDGARPFVSSVLVERLLRAGRTSQAVIPVLPVRDTLKVVKNGIVIETIDRETIRAVQTPQVFEVAILKEAYKTVEYGAYTDEAGIVEALGIPVRTVEGEASNLKVTYPSDLSGVA